MKRYKLKKDTPTLKAGTIFVEEGDNFNDYKELVQVVPYGCPNRPFFAVSEINNFDDWFEEIHEYKRRRAEIGDLYYFIDDSGNIEYRYDYDNLWDKYRHSTGNYGLIKQELEAKREYDIARQVLLDDADGGKWKKNGINLCMYYNHNTNRWAFDDTENDMHTIGVIYFQDRRDAQKSLDDHKEQWEIVREYEIGEM